jgi:hypothetical protein
VERWPAISTVGGSSVPRKPRWLCVAPVWLGVLGSRRPTLACSGSWRQCWPAPVRCDDLPWTHCCKQVLPGGDVMADAAPNSIRANFASIVGPGLAGVMADTSGASTAFAVDGLSYVVSITAIFMVRPRRIRSAASFGWRYGTRRSWLGSVCAPQPSRGCVVTPIRAYPHLSKARATPRPGRNWKPERATSRTS